jgi:hypothetical protein
MNVSHSPIEGLMMKKLLLISTAILGFSTATFAANNIDLSANTGTYRAGVVAVMGKSNSVSSMKPEVKSKMVEPTDITIFNGTPNTLYITTPSLPCEDQKSIYSMTSHHI